MSQVWIFSLLAAVAILSAHRVSAIYEDQAQEYSWNKQFLGRVTHAVFAPKGKERVFVATSSSVLASLDVRSGDVQWRKVLDENDNVEAIGLLHKPPSLITLSRNGTRLRAWQVQDGAMLWDSDACQGGAPGPAALLTLPDVTADGQMYSAVVCGGRLSVVSGQNGVEAWSRDLPAGWSRAQLSLGEGPSKTLTVVGMLNGARGLETVSVALQSGALSDSGSITSPIRLAWPVEAVPAGIVAASADGSQICTSPLADTPGRNGGGSLSCQPVETLSKGLAPVKLTHLLAGTQSVVGAVGPGGAAVLRVVNGNVKLIKFIPGASVLSPLSDKGVAAASPVEGGTARVTVVTVTDGKTLSDLEVEGLELLSTDGQPVPLIGAALAAPTAKNGPKTLLVFEDDSLALVGRTGRLAWLREEALARVTSAAFLELPPPGPQLEAERRAAAPSLADRIHMEVLAAKDQFGAATPPEKAELRALKARLSSRLLPYRDSNGFRKLLVVATSAGKVFGLHSGDGRVLWSLTFPPASAPTHLAVWQTSHDPSHAPQVALFGVAGVSGSIPFAVVDAHAGALLSSAALDFPVVRVLELPEKLRNGPDEQRVFLLVGEGEEPRVGMLPDTPAAKALVGGLEAYHPFWVDKAANRITGYALMPSALVLKSLWSAAFPPADEAILAVAAATSAEAVYSHAKVLGDRSMKIKYLNPNTAFIATGPPDGVPCSALTNPPRLSVVVVDTVTGRFLVRMQHEDARGPVAALFVENWIVYSFHNVAQARVQVAVIEIYDAGARHLSAQEVLFGTPNQTMSSYEPVPLEVLSDSFFFRAGVRFLAATATGHGVTSKLILMGLESDQVYMMDKRFLDPRRPHGTPTADDKAENLIPYAEELPLDPTFFATYDKEVARLSGIVVSPAALESSCLMLAHGLDLMLTRVQPSKSFDLIPDDFPYGLLIAITFAMVVGAVVLRMMEEKAAVKRKWE